MSAEFSLSSLLLLQFLSHLVSLFCEVVTCGNCGRLGRGRGEGETQEVISLHTECMYMYMRTCIYMETHSSVPVSARALYNTVPA